MIRLAAVEEAWARALDLWGVAIRLRPPKRIDTRSGRGEADHWNGNEPLAFIDLHTRQVQVNFRLLEALGAPGSLEALFAHEIGHHIKHPHTLAMAAHLWVMQERLLPATPPSLLNLFFDLLVNEEIGRLGGRRLIEQLAAIYRGHAQGAGGSQHVVPLHEYYLAIYEELWGLHLLGEGVEEVMEAEYGGFRGDARMFAQTFWNLVDPFVQFAYALSRFARYLPQDGKKKQRKKRPGTSSAGAGGRRGKSDDRLPLAGDLPQPDADALSSAIAGHPAVERAIGQAKDRGWLGSPKGAEAADHGSSDPLEVLGKLAGAPGSAVGAFRRQVVSRHYARLVERHLFEVPLADTDDAPEATLPTVTSAWEPGDDVRSIDWTASVLSAGPLAAALPRKRDLELDEPLDGYGKLPAIEIFLDTSGSMPNPAERTNVMTLAAQILSSATIRQGGKVRGAIYSSGPPLVSEWMRAESSARDFFLHYAGGGTQFPFELLREWAEEARGHIRVILSDADFIHNVNRDDAREALAYSVERSAPLVAMLRIGEGARARLLESTGPATRDPRWRLVEIRTLDEFARMAAQLSAALFES